MGYLYEIMNVLKRWERLGNKTTSRGTRLIGAVPHVGSKAYLNSVYAPLKEEDILQIEKDINHSLPESLKEFYKYANGASIFLTLELNGLRKNYDRSLTDNAYQPISIQSQNVFDQPKNIKKNMVFFGGYDWDGSNLFMIDNDPRVFLCSSDCTTPVLFEWLNFKHFLLSEVKRLSEMFDDEGRQVDESIPTIPYSAESQK